jgi:hypothetical protein
VAFSVVLLILALSYKSTAFFSSAESISMGKQEVSEFKELLVFKKRWLDKKTSGRVDKLEKLVPASKVIWKKKGKKLTAKYKDLTPKELNKLITSILNMAVQIQALEISNNNGSYTVEFKCKW